jgi:hypothetical protein
MSDAATLRFENVETLPQRGKTMPRFLPMRCEFASNARDIVAKGTELLKNEVRGIIRHDHVFSTVAPTRL